MACDQFKDTLDMQQPCESLTFQLLEGQGRYRGLVDVCSCARIGCGADRDRPQLVSMWGHRVQESVVFRCWTEDGNEDEDEGDDSDG